MESLEFLPTTFTTPVVFPPPPPTSNTLTSLQRAQLRKSTKKLGKILGETPHLLDADIVSILGPVHVELPPRDEAPSPVLSDSSLDSSSYFSRSSSSLSYYSHPYAAACATSFESRPSTPRSPLSRKPSLGLRSSLDRLTDHFNPHSDINKQGPPILRLAVSPPSSPTSPNTVIVSSLSPSSSPASNRTSGKFNSIHRRSTSIDDDIKNHSSTFFPSSPSPSPSDMRFTLHHARHSNHSTSSSLTAVKDNDIENFAKPSYHFPSSTSASNARRQKMERLRKMLGEDVPVHLVFPDQEKKIAKDGYWIDSKKPTITQDYEVISSGEDYDYPRGLSPVAVAGTVVPRSKTKGKITGARDSMGAVTPHKANRQETQKLRKADPIRHNMKLNSSSPPPPPAKPTLIKVPATLSSLEKDASQKRLCVIVESPEEHGSSALEGFGIGGCTTSMKVGTTTMTKKTNVMVQSSYPVDDCLTGRGERNSRIDEEEEEEEASMNKLWSTRRGYTGWDRSVVFGRSSEPSLSSLQERKKSMGYRRLPIVDF